MPEAAAPLPGALATELLARLWCAEEDADVGPCTKLLLPPKGAAGAASPPLPLPPRCSSCCCSKEGA